MDRASETSGRRGRAAARVVALALLSLAPAATRAGGFTMTIFGGRRTSMMANLARPDDLTAAFTNPAGLADQQGVRLHLSTSLTFLSTDFKLKALDPDRWPAINPPGCGTPGNEPCPWPIGADGYYERQIKPEKYFGVLPYLGASTDLGFLGRRGRDIVVSLAVYAPDFYGAFLPENAPTAYQMIDGMFMVIATTAAVGWRINKHVAVGANLSYNYMRISLAQKMSIADVLTPAGQKPSGEALAGQTLLGDLRLDYVGRDDGLGWSASTLVNPLSWLTFGFTYMGATPGHFRGDVALRALGKLAQAPNALQNVLGAFGYKLPSTLTVEMPIPHALMFGVNVAVRPWLEVGVDYRLWLYNFYKAQRIVPGYDPAQPGKEPLSADGLSRDKRYSVSYEVGGGVLVRPLWRRRPDLELLAGLSYDQSPIPDETFTLDNPSLSQLGGSLGVRLMLGHHLRLALSYMIIAYLARDVRNSQTSPPTNARGRGLAHLPGVELEYFF